MHTTDPAVTRVAVLAGGRSSEREISFSSGNAVAAALKEYGYGTVDLIDPAEDGAFVRLAQGAYDVAFIALHGEGGEDGTIQGALEWLGLPYTGPGVIASACAADKEVSKLICRRAGVPTSPDVVLTKGEDYQVDEILTAVGPECFVKPAVNGSSFGVTPANNADELRAALDIAFSYDDKVLVEKRVRGTEITVGVLGNSDPQALPIVEINPGDHAGFYDLKVKYEDPELHHVIPARLEPDVYARAQQLACAAHRALGCTGLSRSDFIVSPEDGPVILETNTIPGMTAASLYPDEARHAGIEFPELCHRLVELAFERSEQ